MSDQSIIAAESGVAAKTLLPFVALTWGSLKAQMTPAEAKAFAGTVIEAVEAAESDAMLVAFLRERVGLTTDQFATILNDFRLFRKRNEARQRDESTKPNPN